jgi:hypothetical protein
VKRNPGFLIPTRIPWIQRCYILAIYQTSKSFVSTVLFTDEIKLQSFIAYSISLRLEAANKQSITLRSLRPGVLA